MKTEVMIDQKGFYKTVFRLVMPIALQNIINVGVTSTDVVMLGRVSEEALSGVSLANQIYFILSLVFFGLASGGCVLAAQYWGKKDTRTIEKIMGIALRISLTVSAIFAAAAFFAPELMMRIFTNEETVIAEGVTYLKIVSFSYMLSAFTNVYLSMIRSIERVVVATVIYATSLAVNIVLNGIFIFGLFGFPVMGVAGAATGTLCSRILEVILVLYYAKNKNDVVKLRWKDFVSRYAWLEKDFFVYALPVLLNEFAWGAGMAALSSIVGHLGSASVAAHSVAQVCRQLSMVVAFGTANATAILVGKAIGEKREELAKEYASRLLKLSLYLGILGGLFLLLITPVVCHTMKLSDLSRSYLQFMMFTLSYYVVGQSINCTLVVGVFRGGGDTLFGLFLDVGIMWSCSILAAAIAAFVLHVPMPWVYLVLCSDEIIKIPICMHRYRSYKWLKNITRQA